MHLHQGIANVQDSFIKLDHININILVTLDFRILQCFLNYSLNQKSLVLCLKFTKVFLAMSCSLKVVYMAKLKDYVSHISFENGTK